MREETYFFNTFFWTNLNRKNASGKKGHENVKKWTSKFDLFSKKYVIIPVNEAFNLAKRMTYLVPIGMLR